MKIKNPYEKTVLRYTLFKAQFMLNSMFNTTLMGGVMQQNWVCSFLCQNEQGQINQLKHKFFVPYEDTYKYTLEVVVLMAYREKRAYNG